MDGDWFLVLELDSVVFSVQKQGVGHDPHPVLDLATTAEVNSRIPPRHKKSIQMT